MAGPIIETALKQNADARRDCLIPLLQEAQETQGYLSRDAIERIARRLGLPASEVYGVATFYDQFRFQPRGRLHIRLCRAAGCHVKGSAPLIEAVKRRLKIDAGQTTRDGLFSLEVVECLGVCALGPVISVNGVCHAKQTPGKARALLDALRRKGDGDESAG